MFKKLFCCALLLVPGLTFASFGNIGGGDEVKSGFLLGAKPCMNIPVADDVEGLSSGMGFDLHIGWRFPQNMSMQASYLFSMHTVEVGSIHEDLGWGGLILDFRYHIPIVVNVYEAYVVVGTGSYALVDTDADGLTGMGFNFGAGFGWWVNKGFSFGPELIFHPLSYSSYSTGGNYYTLDDKVSGSTFSIAVTANYQF